MHGIVFWYVNTCKFVVLVNILVMSVQISSLWCKFRIFSVSGCRFLFICLCGPGIVFVVGKLVCRSLELGVDLYFLCVISLVIALGLTFRAFVQRNMQYVWEKCAWLVQRTLLFGCKSMVQVDLDYFYLELPWWQPFIEWAGVLLRCPAPFLFLNTICTLGLRPKTSCVRVYWAPS